MFSATLFQRTSEERDKASDATADRPRTGRPRVTSSRPDLAFVPDTIRIDYNQPLIPLYGPVMQFVVNYNLAGFYSFIWCSQIFTAIIATDRCYCILQPLRYQTLIRTSTMTAIIAGIFLVVGGIFFFVVTRYRIACALDPITGTIISIITPAEFYWRHQQFVDYLDGFMYGAALPTLVVVVVITATIITIIKLRQAVQWRTGTSSSSSVTQKEIGLTKMLVGNSIFFIMCVIPFMLGRIIVLFVPELNPGKRLHNFHMMAIWVLTAINYFNASFNFFIYYSMGSRYREAFWQLFKWTSSRGSGVKWWREREVDDDRRGQTVMLAT